MKKFMRPSILALAIMLAVSLNPLGAMEGEVLSTAAKRLGEETAEAAGKTVKEQAFEAAVKRNAEAQAAHVRATKALEGHSYAPNTSTELAAKAQVAGQKEAAETTAAKAEQELKAAQQAHAAQVTRTGQQIEEIRRIASKDRAALERQVNKLSSEAPGLYEARQSGVDAMSAMQTAEVDYKDLVKSYKGPEDVANIEKALKNVATADDAFKRAAVAEQKAVIDARRAAEQATYEDGLSKARRETNPKKAVADAKAHQEVVAQKTNLAQAQKEQGVLEAQADRVDRDIKAKKAEMKGLKGKKPLRDAIDRHTQAQQAKLKEIRSALKAKNGEVSQAEDALKQANGALEKQMKGNKYWNWIKAHPKASLATVIGVLGAGAGTIYYFGVVEKTKSAAESVGSSVKGL